MQPRWISDTVLSRFQALVNQIVIFSETCGKNKYKPEFNKIKIPLLSSLNLLFKEEMPDNADQMVASLSTAIFQTLKSIGSKKIGKENNIEFINTLIEATREQTLFRNACEDEINKINAKRNGYDLILMSKDDFKSINLELNKKPILAWDHKGHYKLWGCDQQDNWKKTKIDKKKMSIQDKKELIEAREKTSIVRHDLTEISPVGPGIIFVKPQTSLFNTLIPGHTHHYNKKAQVKIDPEELIQAEKTFMLELRNVADELTRKKIDDEDINENPDEILIELDNKEDFTSSHRIGALTHLDTKEELLKKINSIGTIEHLRFSPFSLFKRAASYYPKLIAVGTSLNLVGMGIGGLTFLSNFLGETLDALIHADQTGITHEAVVAMGLCLAGTTITIITLTKSSECTSSNTNEMEEMEYRR